MNSHNSSRPWSILASLSFYLTFNPGENGSPIALLYAAENIDVKSFSPQLYAAEERLNTMLANPLTVVEYFHRTINTIIQALLKGGMFGELVHHYGPIEYLGRGPPHTHLVVYPSKYGLF